MSIDFLDRLEAELRDAAERRGAPRRRRPPTGALKVIVAAAAVALLVFGAARLVGSENEAQPARPTPAVTPSSDEIRSQGSPIKTAVATSADPSSLPVFASRLAKTAEFEFIAPANGRPALADPSLGSVVLYRDLSSDFATVVARAAGITRVRSLTADDEKQIDFNVRGAKLVIVFGADEAEQLLQDSGECAPAGQTTVGDLSLCVVHRNSGTVSGFLVHGLRLPVDAMPGRGSWTWAAASPDGKTILAQWSGECEVPQAVLIDALGGAPRPITVDASVAYGWSTDGRAIIVRPDTPACGDGGAPGLYLVTPDGEPSLLGKAVPRDLTRSLVPRDMGRVAAAP